MTLFRRLSLATTLTTLGVIGVGGLVRATGSGDGCPDWPRCFGHWIPPLRYHALIEYSHRTIGAVAIALLLVTAAVAVVRHRHQRSVLVPILIATPSILMQAILGAIVVHVKTTPDLRKFEPTLVTFHIATAMALIGLLVLVTVRAYRPGETIPPPSDPGLVRFARWTAASVYLLILVGAYIRGEHAGLAFGDWPLMNGGLLPSLSGQQGEHFAHRAAAAVVGIVIAAFVIRVVRTRPKGDPIRRFAVGAGVLFAAQVVVGGIQVWTRLAPAPVVAHVVLSGAIWATLVATAVLARRTPADTPTPQRPVRPEPAPLSGAQFDAPTMVAPVGLATRVNAYWQLTKPRIITLLLIVTVPSMMLAARGMPSIWLMVATVAGGAIAAGSANTLNMVVDRDIDAIMSRTRNRPLPSHSVTPTRALVFGMVLAAVSFFFMSATTTIPAALLAQSAIVFYVFVYTMILKRSTPQNIVIGGAAGAIPALVAWASVTGTVSWDAVVLFAIVFFWTPPHFWALAMRHARDYEAAGIPMLPVVAGERETSRQIVAYTVVTVATSLALIPVAGMGLVYAASAPILGLWFFRDALRLRRIGPRAAMPLFRTSILYLALIFAAVGVDALAHVRIPS